MNQLSYLKRAVAKLGIGGVIRLLGQKRAKKRRLARLVRTTHGAVKMIAPRMDSTIGSADPSTIERADAMLADENYVFTFLHHLKNIPDPWNFDPLEHKYWPKKKYEETRVHSGTSPRDVKIVWEINRFKYLPLLAEAACQTKNKKYADEILWRILSWIEGNPFAESINWSSPLEIAIRALSWSVSLRILQLAGFDLTDNEQIAGSLWEHIAYLNAGLSTDKIVRTNHLIGETAGLYVLSSLFDFPEAVFFKLRAKKFLTQSILEQTYSDGASKESSGWYHLFVTDFADLAMRVSHSTGDSLGPEFTGRYRQMLIYRNSINLPDGDPVRYGDCDFGRAVHLSSEWRDIVFGQNPVKTAERRNYFREASHITAMIGNNYFFARAGDFGWGGDGFSSHAHDDFLSPVLALDKVNILVDPGTYVYNGSPETRNNERIARSHNTILISDPETRNPKPEIRPSFGWITTRPPAFIEYFSESLPSNDDTLHEGRPISAKMIYGEWNGRHSRHFTLTKEKFIVEDHLHFPSDMLLEWNFHFHPRWRIERISPSKFALHDFRNFHFTFELSREFKELEVLPYENYPAYGQKSKAFMIRIKEKISGGQEQVVKFTLLPLIEAGGAGDVKSEASDPARNESTV